MRRRLLPVVVAGVGALGSMAWWLRRVVLPPRPDEAPTARPHPVHDPQQRPSPDGAGVLITVNPSSGPAWTDDPTDELRAGLPAAHIIRVGEDDDLQTILADSDARVVGAAGGDGTLSAAAAVALERDAVLVAVPAGTFNHLARDLGLDDPADAIEAVRNGTATRIDLGVVATSATRRTFVNTLSFGGYTQIVDARERLEPRLGKWLALVVALATQLPRMQSLHLEVDGRPTVAWLGWIGNCRYAPDGFGPSWRERLDDGRLDVRLVLGGRTGARARLVLDVLVGRLRHCPFYRELSVESLDVRSLDGPLRLAVDGETIDGGAELRITKLPRALLVAVP